MKGKKQHEENEEEEEEDNDEDDQIFMSQKAVIPSVGNRKAPISSRLSARDTVQVYQSNKTNSTHPTSTAVNKQQSLNDDINDNEEDGVDNVMEEEDDDVDDDVYGSLNLPTKRRF